MCQITPGGFAYREVRKASHLYAEVACLGSPCTVPVAIANLWPSPLFIHLNGPLSEVGSETSASLRIVLVALSRFGRLPI